MLTEGMSLHYDVDLLPSTGHVLQFTTGHPWFYQYNLPKLFLSGTDKMKSALKQKSHLLGNVPRVHCWQLMKILP